MKNKGLKITVGVLAVLLVVSFIVDAGRDNGGTANTIKSTETDTETSRVQVSIDDDTIKGDSNAPVTIVEFSDFQCPFCARFYTGAYQQIKQQYIDTGKVKFVYRDFPLGNHEYAQKAAEAAECADDQGKYYEMHDKLFETGLLDVANLKLHASNLGLDTAKFDECLDSGKYYNEVQKDFKDGQAAGVDGTPQFFINGIRVRGAQPFSAFQQIIEAELAS
jgi:protein-disulfide isomerase